MAICNDPALSREVYNGDATEQPPYKITRLIQPLSQQLKGAMSHNTHARANENKLEKDGSC